MWQAILFSTVAGVIGTLIGALVLMFVKVKNDTVMAGIMSFAAGFMLAMICFDMLPESTENSGVSVALLGAALGVGLVFGIGKLMERPLERLSDKQGGRFTGAGFMLILAIGLHNLPEGMAIGSLGSIEKVAAFAALIAVHNIPEGMAMCALLRSGGLSGVKSVAFSALAGVPTVIGAIIGRLVSNISPIFMGLCLSLAAGAMLFIVFDDVMEEAYRTGDKRCNSLAAIFGVLIGFGIISML